MASRTFALVPVAAALVLALSACNKPADTDKSKSSSVDDPARTAQGPSSPGGSSFGSSGSSTGGSVTDTSPTVPGSSSSDSSSPGRSASDSTATSPGNMSSDSGSPRSNPLSKDQQERNRNSTSSPS